MVLCFGCHEGGFFMFDGTVKAIPCLVEDFVFTTTGDNLGLIIIQVN
jgi:hypothetical protein